MTRCLHLLGKLTRDAVFLALVIALLFANAPERMPLP